jgi:uncharacterized protein YciI
MNNDNSAGNDRNAGADRKFTRYVILLNEIPGKTTTSEIVHSHVQYLKGLDKAGKLVMCGPFTDYKGGMVVIKAADINDAQETAKSDPFVREGFRTYELRTWKLSCEENNHMGMG